METLRYVIHVERLTKTYGDFYAIEEVSFRIREGEIVGFLGPNGAGKTTTMKILTGHLPPNSGTVRLAGFDVFQDPDAVKRHVGYLPEFPPLYPEMTVRGYLNFVARIKEVPASRIRSRVDTVMGRTGVQHVADRILGNLSRGYQQRVGLAQALVHDPPVLILDEPTVGLDPNQIVEVRELIRTLRRERTVILSTHILPEVSATCERIILIHEGMIVADGTEAALARGLGTDRDYILRVSADPGDAVPVFGGLPDVVGLIILKDHSPRPGTTRMKLKSRSDLDLAPSINDACLASGWRLLELRPPGESLEEVFVRLTTSDVSSVTSPPLDDPDMAAGPGGPESHGDPRGPESVSPVDPVDQHRSDEGDREKVKP